VELVSNSSTGTGSTSRVTFTADGTSAYYIVAEGVNAATGTLHLNVAATLPPVTLTPAGLDFGTLFIGQTSVVQSVTLQNNSLELIDVSSVQIGGTNASDFFVSADMCTGNRLATGGNCQILVQFVPTAIGLRTATLEVFDSATGSPHTIPLTGVGSTPAAVVCASASSLTFSNTTIGFTSALQTITITNCGLSSLFITNAVRSGAAAGDYIISPDACTGQSIAPGNSCDIGIAFVPTTSGVRAATLQLNNSATNGPTKFTLSGVGTAPAPQVCLSGGTSITFGNQQVGGTSAVQSVTVTNCGTAALRIGNVSLVGANAGDFILSGVTCGSNSVAIGGTCSFGVSFAPTNMGPKTASVSITDNTSDSPRTIALSGAGAGTQPNLLINKNLNIKKFLGNGVFSPPSPVAAKTLSLKGKRGKKLVFYVAFQNRGNGPDSFMVQGNGGAPGIFTVQYFLGAYPSESTNVTSAVVGGSFSTATLAPGALTSDATMMRVEITASRAAPPGVIPVVITGTSSANPAKADSVRALITAK
jgi:hypothetical protein